ncbi:MAG: caspase family protein [Chloroflexota bacterium]
MKRAVCIGINNYPGSLNDLNGCVNDAKDWAVLLQGFGFEVSLMLDSQATRQNVKAALSALVSSTGAGEVAVFTYSGHGTQSFDFTSDEADSYDEVLSVYDGNIVDDDLRTIINTIHPQATLVVISDSCFSGTVTRLTPTKARPRFMPPAHGVTRNVVNRRFLLPEADMPEILISGCTDSEYSYDAEFNGRPNGAMSAYALQVIKQNPNQTYQEFYEKLRAHLPSSDYPQTPQLEGKAAHRNTLLFEPFPVSPTPEPEPTPEPTPEPQPESPGCVLGAFRQIARWFKG